MARPRAGPTEDVGGALSSPVGRVVMVDVDVRGAAGSYGEIPTRFLPWSEISEVARIGPI